jgi:uncharacterized protein YlaI
MKEKCVICGVETPYDRETHIDQRLYYVEGCGQMCEDCYKKSVETHIDDFEPWN